MPWPQASQRSGNGSCRPRWGVAARRLHTRALRTRVVDQSARTAAARRAQRRVIPRNSQHSGPDGSAAAAATLTPAIRKSDTLDHNTSSTLKERLTSSWRPPWQLERSRPQISDGARGCAVRIARQRSCSTLACRPRNVQHMARWRGGGVDSASTPTGGGPEADGARIDGHQISSTAHPVWSVQPFSLTLSHRCTAAQGRGIRRDRRERRRGGLLSVPRTVQGCCHPVRRGGAQRGRPSKRVWTWPCGTATATRGGARRQASAVGPRRIAIAPDRQPPLPAHTGDGPRSEGGAPSRRP
jgi:hypothetical protein